MKQPTKVYPLTIEGYTAAQGWLERVWEALGKRGGRVELRARRYRRRRTSDQNSRYWAILRHIQEERYENEGYLTTAEDIHQQMRDAVFGGTVETVFYDEVLGREITLRQVRSTTGLSTMEFSDYCEHVMRLAREAWDVDWSDFEQEEE